MKVFDATLLGSSFLALLAASLAAGATPAQDVLVVYNHGSSSGFDCRVRAPRWLRAIAAKAPRDLNVRLVVECTDRVARPGSSSTHGGCGARRICERVTELKNRIERDWHYQYQPRQIFLAGKSAGAWVSLLLKRRHPELFNGVIAVAPAFGGRRRARLCRDRTGMDGGNAITACRESGRASERRRFWRGWMRYQHDVWLGLGQTPGPRLDALVIAFHCDTYGWPTELPFGENPTVRTHMFPPLQSAVESCAIPSKRWRYAGEADGSLAATESIRCKFETGDRCALQASAPTCHVCSSSLKGSKYAAKILGCPPGLDDLCQRDPHSRLSSTREFEGWLRDTVDVYAFIRGRLATWKDRPVPDDDAGVCDFIPVTRACGDPGRIDSSTR